MIKLKVGTKASNGTFCGLRYYNESKRYSMMLYAMSDKPEYWVVDILNKGVPIHSFKLYPRGDITQILLEDRGFCHRLYSLHFKDAELRESDSEAKSKSNGVLVKLYDADYYENLSKVLECLFTGVPVPSRLIDLLRGFKLDIVKEEEENKEYE